MTSSLEKEPIPHERVDAPSESPALRIVSPDEEPSTAAGDKEFPQIATNGDSLPQWNNPSINMWRFLVTLLDFFAMGMSDGSFGALVPYLEDYYSISYTLIALVFLAPFIGYTLAALLNNKLHMHYGQRGIAFIGPCAKVIAYLVACLHPPYPVIPIIFVLTGLGNGLQDGAWNAWVGNMESANELMGILHGAYGLGATIGPLIATAMVTKAALPWYRWFYVLLGIAVLELICGLLAFWRATGSVHRITHTQSSNGETDNSKSRTREALNNRVTWLVAIFLLGYVGVEVSFGGWLVTFMLRVRNGGNFESGLVVTGFWLGLTVGRVVLGFITGRIGEKIAILGYLVLSMAFELLFWLIPSFISSAIFAGFLGFFLGPLFPAAIIEASRLLPRHLHVSAIGFAAAFGGGGAAVFPFAVGAIAQAKGVQVLQPIALVLLVAILLVWCMLPGGFKRKPIRRVQLGQAGLP